MRLLIAIVSLLIAAALTPADVDARDKNPGGVSYGTGALTFSAGFIASEIRAAGTVMRTTDDRQVVGTADMVYLKMARPEDVSLGARYTVYRRVHKVFHPHNRRYLGDLISILGVVRITAVDQDVATARIERAYTSIAPGAAIMPFEPPAKAAPASGAAALPESPGTVVDMQVQRTLIGQYHLIYLDWGRDDGLRPGDVLDVYRIRPNIPPRIIGEVRILSAQDRTASGVLQRTILPVLIGDRVLARETVKDIAHELELPAIPAEPGVKPPEASSPDVTPPPAAEPAAEPLPTEPIK